ncbi:MAG: DNA gyrase/topoisomerase IV subunit A [Bacteroidales bacterium]|nr:DNA gyrase/topoisomerase IV subunit A [Bacteroidales bacterium]
MEWKSKNFFPHLQKNPYLCNPSKNLFRSKTMSEEINEEEKTLPQPDKGDSDDRIAGGVQNHLHLKSVSGMYRNWFIDYASYVILERAVPEIDDGLKPVQRRILHAMKRLDDGRYNKVANIVGFTMQYHPHGDASIGDALVQLGQKELLIDTQGNWGNILTGDSAAAPRYIEARLSKLALDVVFNPKTTQWKLSYDGRNKEPITLPVKFPLLLAQGVEGIAVGLSSKILPHNFNELMDASIAYLRGEEFVLYPDFLTGGSIDVSKYQDGARGGKLRVRAKIEKVDKRMLAVTELPYGTTTESLTESIKSASEKGKIKIKHIDDKTAATVRIEITLNPDVSPDVTIDALYAFTDCEISLSANSCVIMNDKPHFLSTTEILKHSVDRTVALLTQELQILLNELADSWHDASLEKIFIENHIYNLIEDCETWEAIVETIDTALNPFKHLLKKPVTIDDITHLTELKIKRISKYDAFKADNYIKSLEKQMEEAQYKLDHIIDYAIEYYQGIKDKYGKLYPRRTEIKSFDNIVATEVAVANEKLYVNWQEGFAGMALKKDEFVCNCSNLDEVIVFHKTGKYTISKISDKFFIGNDAIYVNVFRKNDERTIYNAIYRDGKTGITYAKRFNVKGITRDKEYDLTQGTDHTEVTYFSANANGEAEVVKILLKPKAKLKKRSWEFDFGTLAVKNRAAMGNIITKYPVHKITKVTNGVSTLGGLNIWFDTSIGKLNTDGHGEYIGEFAGDDKIVTIRKTGHYRITGYDLSTHFDDDIVMIRKFDPEEIYSLAYYDDDLLFCYLKRFKMELSDKEQYLLGDSTDSKLYDVTADPYPLLRITFGGKNEGRPEETINAVEFIGDKSFRARGKRVSNYEVATMKFEHNPDAPAEPEPTDSEDNPEDWEDPEFEVVRVDEDGQTTMNLM